MDVKYSTILDEMNAINKQISEKSKRTVKTLTLDFGAASGLIFRVLDEDHPKSQQISIGTNSQALRFLKTFRAVLEILEDRHES